MAIIGIALLGLGIVRFWASLLLSGAAGLTDPYSELSALERLSTLILVTFIGGGLQAIAGWYLWRRAPALLANAYPFGVAPVLRAIGYALLAAAALLEAALVALLFISLELFLTLMPYSVPLILFGVTCLWIGATLKPVAKAGAAKGATASRAQRRKRR